MDRAGGTSRRCAKGEWRGVPAPSASRHSPARLKACQAGRRLQS